jgi:hypothetical protein
MRFLNGRRVNHSSVATGRESMLQLINKIYGLRNIIVNRSPPLCLVSVWMNELVRFSLVRSIIPWDARPPIHDPDRFIEV